MSEFQTIPERSLWLVVCKDAPRPVCEGVCGCEIADAPRPIPIGTDRPQRSVWSYSHTCDKTGSTRVAERAPRRRESQQPTAALPTWVKMPKGKRKAVADPTAEKEAEDEPADEENDDDDDDNDEEYEEKPKKGKKGKKKTEGMDDEEDDEPAAKDLKKKKVAVTLTRINGSLGLALDNNHVTAVHAGGAAAEAGILIGDVVMEVNGKDTSMDSFGSLLPKDKSTPIKLRLLRYVKDDGPKKKKPKKAEEEAAEKEGEEGEEKKEEEKEGEEKEGEEKDGEEKEGEKKEEKEKEAEDQAADEKEAEGEGAEEKAAEPETAAEPEEAAEPEKAAEETME